MHVDELHTDVALVRRLLAGQFPEWAALPLERVLSSGTDNALYRLGDDMVVRLPRIRSASGGVDKDLRWLPLLAPRLPVSVPVPLAKGAPADGYPWEWGVYPWLDGENPTAGGCDPEKLTADLIRFIGALHRIDAPGPTTRRGAPLASQDEEARRALATLEGTVDVAAATAAWGEALQTPAWAGRPVWIHGDLLPGNLLVQRGRLTAVIDWSLTGAGDPACDLMVAWALLPTDARDVLRGELRIDDATWARGRGWALSLGLIALPYYKETNPQFAATARHLINEVLADTGLQ
jgi:aminoglycoside phosphotransferase (APT) family kinase protein